jgi:hypothetical protein
MIVVATGLVGVVRGISVAGCKTINAPPRGAVPGLLRCFGRAVLFDRSADLRHDIGAGPLGPGEQSSRDLTCAPDGERLGTQHLVATPSEGRRLLRADRHGRLQTGELGLGEDELDHECTSMASGINRRDAPHALQRGGQGLRSGPSSGERSRCGARSGARGGSTNLPLDASAGSRERVSDLVPFRSVGVLLPKYPCALGARGGDNFVVVNGSDRL